MTEYFTLTDTGKVRKSNEDYISTAQTENGILLVVCDGLGGLQGGEIASSLAAETITHEFRNASGFSDPYTFLSESTGKANRKLQEFVAENPEYDAIGTTLAAAYIKNNELFVCHVGDSRVYLLKGEKLIQVTKDHSIVREFVDMGIITAEEAFNHPDRNLITRSLGDPVNCIPDITGPLKLDKGDRVFLCTDGVNNHLTDAEIHNFLSAKKYQKVCDKILAACLKKGGTDNISMICLIF
ncbi:MAG: Stp1/IreP family PP2C-type Ser/Thr phosphatase [Ignavibacteriaceae bacterium]|nr:Stp1/IreP family PP2C-type Ser/Thr phosphatase [Ignavibacteriaceae bacterium]